VNSKAVSAGSSGEAWVSHAGAERGASGTGGGAYDAVVVGAGVIGLAIGRELAGRGARVAVVDRAEPGGAATRVAAGMLAPVAEAAYGERQLLEMTLAAAREYPDFVAGLEAETGRTLDYTLCGAIHIALDRDEAAELQRRREFLAGLGLEPRWLGPSACRELEPGLAPSFHGGIRVPEEAAIDPRQLSRALAEAVGAAPGVELLTGRAVTAGMYEGARPPDGRRSADRPASTASGSRLVGVRLEDGEELRAERVVLATGAWAGECEWLPLEARPPVRPVKGQILELGPAGGAGSGARPTAAGAVAGSVGAGTELAASGAEPLARGIIATERVYLVPRPDGRLFVGATVEEHGFDRSVTAGGVYELLREAHRALPDLAELRLIEAGAGLRPGTPDNLPLIGPGAIEGLHLATGHYRNGILLAPLTARTVAAQLVGEAPAATDQASAAAHAPTPAGPSSAQAQGVGVVA